MKRSRSIKSRVGLDFSRHRPAATYGRRLLPVKDSWKQQRGRIERGAKTKKLTRADRGAVRKMIMMTWRNERKKEEEAEWRKMLRSCQQDNWKSSFRATGVILSLRNSTFESSLCLRKLLFGVNKLIFGQAWVLSLVLVTWTCDFCNVNVKTWIESSIFTHRRFFGIWKMHKVLF